jgi:hypothetical protein
MKMVNRYVDTLPLQVAGYPVPEEIEQAQGAPCVACHVEAHIERRLRYLPGSAAGDHDTAPYAMLRADRDSGVR